MALVLGIDTGGTYTDGVIVETATKGIICKAKAPTTKHDLTIGIEECIRKLSLEDKGEIKVVCLSTTLATNAVVEGKGAKTALIYMGFEADESIPAEYRIKVRGKFDVLGNIEQEIDLEEVRNAVDSVKDKVTAIAVSGYASVRNPKHEKQIAAIIREVTDLPVVCAHQLTSALGFEHRTITAVLNARLISIIDDLIVSTRKVLDDNSIIAPIMIVKGDGTLMTEDMARQKPIDTILSGPAASVIGGLALTGEKEGMIMDMGGTTTDIGCLSDGKVEIRKEGAKVGGWHTRVQAIEISTFGIGGDSRIYLDERGKVVIGPQKAIPLCTAASKYTYLDAELRSFRRLGELKKYFESEAEIYMLAAGAELEGLTEEQLQVAEIIKNEPHSMSYIARKIGKDPEVVDVSGPADRGIFVRIAPTPTDVLHALGKYDKWDRRISHTGLKILADRKEVNVMKFIHQLENDILWKLALTMVQSCADFNDSEMEFHDSPEAMYLISNAFGARKDSLMKTRISISRPIIALGAPAQVWLKGIEKMLNTRIIVPEDADVANAFGAAVGQLNEKVTIEIVADGSSFILNTPWERTVYPSKEEALFNAIHEGRKYLEHLFMDAGCRKWLIEDGVKDKTVEIDDNHNTQYIGSTVTITGTANII